MQDVCVGGGESGLGTLKNRNSAFYLIFLACSIVLGT